MRRQYIDPDTRVAVNLSNIRWDGIIEPGVYELNRVNTPTSAGRGQGHASRLLRHALADADAAKSIIWLWIGGSFDGLGHDQLRAWYLRLGFAPTRLIFDHGFYPGTIYVRWQVPRLRQTSV